MKTHSQLRPRWTPYLFLFPFISVFAVFMLYPLFQSIFLSMEQTFGPQHSEFVFLKNYKDLFADPLFWKALKNTFIFSAISVVLQMPISLGLALLLNQDWIRGRNLFRLIFFSPILVGAVFVGVIFSIIFQKRTGLLNIVLNRLIGFDIDFPWLQEYIMPALILAALWMSIGFNMIYFLAALQNVDKSLSDASRVDGADAWQRFCHVTLPAIRPIAGFVMLISLIGSFQLFELPYLLLNGPGSENRGLTIVLYLYQTGFQTGDLGYASAIGWILALLLVSLTLIQRRLNRNESW